MKTTKISVLISILAILFFSCTKDDQRGFPSVTTLSNAEVFNDGTVIHATVSQEYVAEIIDHGVIYYMSKNINDENSYEKISQGPLTTNSFSVLIERNLVKNTEYTAKAFVVTKEKTVYGNEITFMSKGGKAPVINSFWPEKGFAGDTITIRGQYFSSKNYYNKVVFDNLTASVFSSTDTLLRVIVPVLNESVSSFIRVEVAGLSGQAAKKFELKEPVIYEIIPDKIMPGESFLIRGKGFNTINKIIRNAKPFGSEYEIQSKTDTLLKVRSNGNDIYEGAFEIVFHQLGREVYSGKKLTIFLTKITSVSPTTVWLESVVEIKGTNLNKISEILFDETPTEILTKEDNLIKVKVIKPFSDAYIYGKVPNSNTVNFHGTIIKFKRPVISSVTPSVAMYGETLNVTGDYFVPGITTYANGENTFNYISKTQATSSVPWILPAGFQSFQLLLGGYPFSYATLDFVIPQIKIASVTPTEINKGTEIFIELTDVPQTITKSRVASCMLENNPMTVTEVSPNGIKAIVNETFNCTEYPGIYLTIGAQDIDGQQIVHLNQPWKKFNFPTLQIQYSVLPYWVPEENSLYAISPLDVESGFVYKYSPASNKWYQLTDLFRFGTQLFSAKVIYSDNALYIFGYNYSEQAWNIHKYGIITKKWTKLKSIPDTSANAEYGGNLFAFVVNNRIFAGKRDWLFEFDATNNQWIQKAKIPTTREIFYPAVMVWNSKILLGFPTYSTVNSEFSLLFEYDPQINEWKNLGEYENAFFANHNGGAYTTLYNNKFYITGRSRLTGFTKLNEFDPVSLSFREMVAPTQITNGAFLIYESEDQMYLGNSLDVFYKIPVSQLNDIYK